jgi:hypothetical protein
MWVMGGDNKKDVWWSTDGANWTQATAIAGWGEGDMRTEHQSISYDSKMWVMGGYYAGKVRSDVWWSTDGVSWTKAVSTAPWSGRMYFGACSYDNKMWIMGGYNNVSGARYNDVWWSTDGVNWTQATALAGWERRECLVGGATNNRICIYGGAWYKDVWCTNTVSALDWTGETNYSSDGVDPETGASSTSFIFRVKYIDVENDAPSSGYPKLHIKKDSVEISGSPFTMTETDEEDADYSDGKFYAYTKILSASSESPPAGAGGFFCALF